MMPLVLKQASARQIRGTLMNIKKRLSRLTAFAIPVFMILSLSGCISVEKENGTVFELSEDGEVSQTIVDDADESVTGEELENYINELITEYQSTDNQNSVSLERCVVSSGKVNISLSYSSIAAYAAFNNVACFGGTVLEAYSAGYDFNRTFYDTEGNEIPYYELARYCRGGNVLILEENTELSIDGELTAMSDGVEIAEDGSIVLNGEYSDEYDSEYQSTTSNQMFIIYNTEK